MYRQRLFFFFLMFASEVSTNWQRRLLKILWYKEKIPLTSIFSFSHNIFYPIKDKFHHCYETSIVACKCFNCFPNKAWFLRVCSTSLLKTLWEKKLLVTSNFSFSHSVFYPFGELSLIFVKSETKMSSANSFSLEESKICHLGKG